MSKEPVDKFHDNLEVVHHDPKEGYDPTEPDAKSIAFFVVVSIITLVLTMVAVQGYFQKVWDRLTYDTVLSVPGAELGDQRNLENWRLTHYEYTDKTKTTVRIPLEEAKKLVLKDAAEGKTFYPGKPTEPKPETPPEPAKDAAAAAAAGAAEAAKK